MMSPRSSSNSDGRGSAAARGTLAKAGHHPRASHEPARTVEHAADGDKLPDGLLNRLRERDDSSLAALVELYGMRLSAVVASTWRGASQEDVEEVVADVVADAWFKSDEIDERRGSLATWLVMRARYRALDRLRALRREARLRSRLRLLIREPVQEPEYATDLDAYLAGMGELDRRLVAFRFAEGRPVSEVATLCGISTKAAARRLDRLRERLRTQVQG